MKGLTQESFAALLTDLCARLTKECKAGKTYDSSKSFERRVREVIEDLLTQYQLHVDFSPHPFGFPDIVLGKFGVEVKFTLNDTWRSIANSVFEGYRAEEVEDIYIVFGKMGGEPEVKWRRYEDCVMHVRTSHVPRFEVEIDAKESLFKKFRVTYAEFAEFSEDDRMTLIRAYARGRLQKGEHLWWLESEQEDGKSQMLPMKVVMFKNLSDAEKLKVRAEASLLFPQIVGSSHDREKYIDPILFMLTYRGVYVTRDAFSAGSVAGKERGGDHVRRALENIQHQMIQAAKYLEGALFVEYWGRNVAPEKRIKEWLKMAEQHAMNTAHPWKPSDYLFLDLPEAR